MKWILALALSSSVATLAQDTIQVVTYNCESGGSSPAKVAERIAALDGYDVWGLQEVQDAEAAALYEAAAERGENANFESIVGTTGGRYGDFLAIVYDADRLELVGSDELHDINALGRVRAPQVAHFRVKQSGGEFLFVNNHLYRSRADQREWQAQKLNEWGRAQTLPIVAVGDYNFDYHVENGAQDRDAGYDAFTSDGVFRWVRPELLTKTNAHPNYNTVLDFVFVGGAARDWESTSEIVVVAGDFPDNQETSDHRPVVATLALSASASLAGAPASAAENPQTQDDRRHDVAVAEAPAMPSAEAGSAAAAAETDGGATAVAPESATSQGPTLKQQLLQRIAALEAEIAALKALIRELPE